MDSKSQDSGVHKQKFSAFRTDPDCPTWSKKIEVLAMKTLLTLTHLKTTALNLFCRVFEVPEMICS